MFKVLPSFEERDRESKHEGAYQHVWSVRLMMEGRREEQERKRGKQIKPLTLYSPKCVNGEIFS